MNYDFDQSRPGTNPHQLHHQPGAGHLHHVTNTSHHHNHHTIHPQSTGRRIRMTNRGSSLDAELATSTGASLEGGIDIVDSQDDLLYTIQMGRNLNQIEAGNKYRAVSSLSENSGQLKKNANPNTNHTIYGRNISTLPTNLQRIAANGQSKSAMSFRFSTDEISQFRAELGSSVGELELIRAGGGGGVGGCSTRATTPGEEQLVQEPTDSLQVRIGRLLNSEEMADMHFLVGSGSGPQNVTGSSGTNLNSTSPVNRKIRIPAHRIIMASASPWFREMFLNPTTNRLRDLDQGEDGCIEITDVEPCSFMEFLRFCYTDTVRLSKDNCVGLLIAAKRYEVECIEPQCVQFIQKCLAKKTALAIWNNARHYGDIDLENVARRSVQHFAEDILLSTEFLKLDQTSLYEILSDDALRADEIVVFRGLTRWAKQHCLKSGLCPNRVNLRQVIGNALNLIRFPLMTEEQLQKIVAAEGILEDELLRALVHCSRSWSKLQGTSLPPAAFSSEPRAYQRVRGKLMSVYRFAAFEGTAVNRITMKSLNFLTNRRVFLAGVGLYAPRKACTFYLNVWVRVKRADCGSRNWNSPLDYIEQSILTKFDGSDHMINVYFDEPLQVEANVQYVITGVITPTNRTTSVVKSKMHPHLYYTRPADVNFYYGTEGQYATKVRLSSDDNSSHTGSNHRPENVIFNFDWERSSAGLCGNDDSSDSFGSNNGVLQSYGGSVGAGCGGANSEPSTPAPPPRPPPPTEYKRPSRMQRLRRAFSFIDRREDSHDSTINSNNKLSNGIRTDSTGNGNARTTSNWDTLLEGQIPLLMFYA